MGAPRLLPLTLPFRWSLAADSRNAQDKVADTIRDAEHSVDGQGRVAMNGLSRQRNENGSINKKGENG